MQFFGDVETLRTRLDESRSRGERIALVPTMGALHAGHLALVDAARERADFVVVSIFVNPTQFDSATDLDAYPRTFEQDTELCRARGVDAVFAPSVDGLYPPGAQTWVDVGELSRPMEGASRAGHFRGVATVVAKLLLAVRPQVALFGRKDFQQLRVVQRLARDLLLDVEIVGVETVREGDGLALSSRNVHLDAQTRPQARVLHDALVAAERACAAGERRAGALLELVRLEIAKAPLARLDYAELASSDTLEPAPAELREPTLLALAVRFPCADAAQDVRLIDNTLLLESGAAEDPDGPPVEEAP